MFCVHNVRVALCRWIGYQWFNRVQGFNTTNHSFTDNLFLISIEVMRWHLVYPIEILARVAFLSSRASWKIWWQKTNSIFSFLSFEMWRKKSGDFFPGRWRRKNFCGILIFVWKILNLEEEKKWLHVISPTVIWPTSRLPSAWMNKMDLILKAQAWTSLEPILIGIAHP